MLKIEKAYDDKMEKDVDGKWSWSQFWTAMEQKAINLVGKYLDAEMKRQKIKENIKETTRMVKIIE